MRSSPSGDRWCGVFPARIPAATAWCGPCPTAWRSWPVCKCARAWRSFCKVGRGGWIRTNGPYLPKLVLYQAELRLDPAQVGLHVESQTVNFAVNPAEKQDRPVFACDDDKPTG